MLTLYYDPLACSLATRIALYEAGVQARYVQVDTARKRLPDGSDYLQINPMGLVPALRLDDGDTVVTENAAVLQYVAEQFPGAMLVPDTPPGRAKLRQWLSFIGTELHKGVFSILLSPKASDEVKAYARDRVGQRFGVLQGHLAGRDYLLDHFTVADAYLAVVLNWTGVTGIEVAQWPAVKAFQDRVARRPAVAKAFGEEYAMYVEKQAAKKA